MHAIHLCTGDRRDDLRVREWLVRHCVESVSLTDPYDAAVHLLRNASHVPQLAFIGCDRLDAGEARIVDFIREVWPAVVQILYGADRPAHFAEAPLTLFASSRTLEQYLESEPDALIALANGARANPPNSSAADRADAPMADDRQPADPLCAAPLPPTAPIAPSEEALRLERSGLARLPAEALVDVITPAELSALLGDAP